VQCGTKTLCCKKQSQCGAEQEYFLIDAADYSARPDLVMCNRTIQGAHHPRGQVRENSFYEP
jgi:glutamine synthetase